MEQMEQMGGICSIPGLFVPYLFPICSIRVEQIKGKKKPGLEGVKVRADRLWRGVYSSALVLSWLSCMASASAFSMSRQYINSSGPLFSALAFFQT